MKNRELLSIVLSLIMVFGATAGSAYAQTDEVDTTDSTEIEAFDGTVEDETEDETKDDRDEKTDDDNDYSKDGKHDLDDRLEAFCEMTDEEKRQFFAEHPRLEEFADRIANFCDLTEDERDDAIDTFVKEHAPEKMDLDDKLDGYCEMSDEDKRALLAKHDKVEDHAEKMAAYCELDEDARDAYIKDHKDEYKMNHDKDMDKGKHMDYDRLCALSESDRALEFDDLEKLERISNWCDMSPEEREELKQETHDMKENDMKEKRQEALNRVQDNPNVPQRIKEMIMEKRDIVDDRLDELRMKYEEKHGDFDEKKSELKIKFKNHMATMKIEISDERKSAIQDRVAEMKAFKMELRESSADLTDEDKQELRAEFVEKAKDIRLAWISPHQQMNAGIDAAEIECREGFSLVLKESSGRAMCLKADTALKMIDRGLVVPAI